MRRRVFIRLVGGAAASPLAWPLTARAQQVGGARRVGGLWGADPNDPLFQKRFAAFTDGLKELGWVQGKNVSFENRYAIGKPDGLLGLAAELVGANVDVIVVTNTGLAVIAHKATTTIPIVIANGGGLEETGLIASLGRPGGSVTGTQALSPELMSKRVDIMKELIPHLTRLGVIEPVTTATSMSVQARYFEVIAETAHTLGIRVDRTAARGPGEFTSAFSTLAQQGDQAAIVFANPLAFQNREEIANAAEQVRIPTIYELVEYVIAGGLLSYGPDAVKMHRAAASYVDKILRGAKPADLPVQQPTKFDLVINLKTAKALGITIPPSLLARADEVIE